ncbi:MAG: hypothetical protein Q8O64_17875 [Sideroxyarcus sp.]|nr:hypothetical protein [Sideroxyarcus sp.]
MSAPRLRGGMEGLPMCIGRVSIWLATLACVLALNGCATYSNSFAIIEQQLDKQHYDEALKTLETQAGDQKDRVLYLLNKGMVQRMKHDFAASNESLEAAKQEMERLYAESVSEHALSFMVNDATVSYAGDDYEQVLVHLYMALNYLELGQPDEARVEALQIDLKLRAIAEKIPDSKFTEDALSRQLTGMIYDELGEWSDAMIAYRKAYEAYKKNRANFSVDLPTMLQVDLLRLAQRQGLTDELARYQQEFSIAPTPETTVDNAAEGELVFILNNGLAPIKRETVIGMWAPPPSVAVDASKGAKNTDTTPTTPPVLINIALPYYESRPSRIVRARISVSGKQADTEMMEDIDAIARANLAARMPAITARAVARAIAKGVMQASVDKSGQRGDDAAAKMIGSLLVRVATIATERADTRSWLTLPANVQLARLSLPPGSYDVTVELLGRDENLIATRVYPQITIRQTRKTYLSQHSMPY